MQPNKLSEEGISKIEDLIEYAWQRSIKYRFDPVAGRIHQEYLALVKNLKLELDKGE